MEKIDRSKFIEHIRTTAAQRNEMCGTIKADNRFRNEKVWTLLVADLLAYAPDQQVLVDLLCSEQATVSKPFDVWFEAQPLPPRKGTQGDSEGNTRVDLAFGQIQRRGQTGAGIAYDPRGPDPWVCFVEAKCMSDCSSRVTYDPLRNQLARVIENLMTFQDNGQFPEKIFFALITPRLFKENISARLYGYKMREYADDSSKLLQDLELCRIPKRSGAKYVYPDLSDRLRRLTLKWVTYEDLLERQFGGALDILKQADKISGLQQHLEELLCVMQSASAELR